MDTLRDIPRSTEKDKISDRNDRDERFKNILREQFGKSGISLLVLYSFIMIIAILLLALVSVSFASTNATANVAAISDEPLLVY
nr:GrBNV_gp59-like protein [Apis mellifera nudivirus]